MAPGIVAGITLTVSFALLAAWLFYFTPATIRRVGNVYAERLFEHLSGLKGSSRTSKNPLRESVKNGGKACSDN